MIVNRGLERSDRGSIVFHLHEGVGTLEAALAAIKELRLNMTHIESRPSRDQGWEYDFLVTFENITEAQLKELDTAFKSKGVAELTFSTSAGGIAWFPRTPEDLDSFSTKSLEYGAELEADHPGFTDQEYRKRRIAITNFARSFKYGQRLPDVEYTAEEVSTWRTVYTHLRALSTTHACKQYNYIFPLLEQNAGYSPDRIPQLHDVSKFLKRLTGWTLRPVTGLLTPRDFLNGLAFRVFHSTQYIRHHSKPMYTPEPDVCHELIGHVPLFADAEFADFSQEIGLASLGASDSDIDKLSTVYWFTVEFGLCKEGGKMKAYGAGLLSSFGELEYCLSGKPELAPFNPSMTAVTKYPITMYQPLYYYTESFEDAKRKVKEFAATLERPFTVRYNALTERIEVLDTKHAISAFSKGIRNDMTTLTEALDKLIA